jgi:hypothetical protein
MFIRQKLALAVFIAAAPFAVAEDTTPPVVTPNVSGTLGTNGWYVSDVAISWTIVDEESSVFTTTGCEGDVLTQDDTSRTYTCSATSEGGTTAVSQTISRDTAAPVITYSENLGTYQVSDSIRIFCEDVDVTSGIASSTCADISGEALDLIGVNTFSSTATDNAGNVATVSGSFEVQVTTAGIGTLVDQYVANPRVARTLKRKLESGNIDSFVRTVNRETGKSISATDAATLLRLVALL